jgi:hypothetical protein
MAVSGSTDFELDVADYIEEAFERCGLEVRTGYDLKTAKRSLNLLFADWANRGLNQWTIKQRSFTVTEDDGQYDLGTDVVDLLSLVVRLDDADTYVNTVSMPFRFYPALAAGLAYYIAIKRAPDRIQLLKPMYEEELARAMDEDRDRASFHVAPDLRTYRYV